MYFILFKTVDKMGTPLKIANPNKTNIDKDKVAIKGGHND